MEFFSKIKNKIVSKYSQYSGNNKNELQENLLFQQNYDILRSQSHIPTNNNKLNNNIVLNEESKCHNNSNNQQQQQQPLLQQHQNIITYSSMINSINNTNIDNNL